MSLNNDSLSVIIKVKALASQRILEESVVQFPKKMWPNPSVQAIDKAAPLVLNSIALLSSILT